MDNKKCFDDVGDDFYIADMYEVDEAAHGDWSDTLIDESYWDMMTDDLPKQEKIDNASCIKYIGAEVKMGVPGEGPRRSTFRCHVEESGGTKVGTYHRNPLMDTCEYKLEYNDVTHDRYLSNVISKDLYSNVGSEGHKF